MIKELAKHEAVYIWNNLFQGTFTPTTFDEFLKSNDVILEENWLKEIGEIKNTINGDLFQSFLEKYRGSKVDHAVDSLESFVKDGQHYLKLNLCLGAEHSSFMACFLLDLDYTVQYLCIDSKIEIETLPHTELNTVYKKYKQLIPPPLDFIAEFNRMNDELSALTGRNVDRTMYQAWFKLVPTLKFDPTFAKAYNAYQQVGESLFDETKQVDKGSEFEYLAVV